MCNNAPVQQEIVSASRGYYPLLYRGMVITGAVSKQTTGPGRASGPVSGHWIERYRGCAARHSAGAFHGSKASTVAGSVKSAVFASFISQVR